MTRPSRDAVLMQHAVIVAQRSTCQRGQVGCVVAKHGRILVTGYNGAPSGMAHCEHTEYEEWQDLTGASLGKVWTGKDAEPCTNAVHAECNVIAYAARWGITLEGAELFTTMAPCRVCAQLIVNAGIVRVVPGAPYHSDGIELLKEAGIQVEVSF